MNVVVQKRLPVLMIARQLGLGGGIERDVSKYARHLPQWGIDTHVICFQREGARYDEIEQAGIPIQPLPLPSFRSKALWQAAWAVRRYIAKNNIKLVHSFDLGANIFAAITRPVTGARVVMTSHLWRRKALDRSAQRALFLTDKLVSEFFVNCNAVKKELETESKIGHEHIHVCHNGFETSEFHSKDRQRPVAVREASTVFGTVAVFREEKNLSMLVSAFAEVVKSDSKAKLLLIGEGPYLPSLQQQVQQLDISDSVHFYPATSTPAHWMRAIDVYVLPSRSEAFSNALLESMACGCCPVGSNIGGTPELIEHGKNGLLFEVGNESALADNLRLLSSNPELRRRMAVAAEDFVHRNFTIEVTARRLAEIYRGILERSSQSHLQQPMNEHIASGSPQ